MRVVYYLTYYSFCGKSLDLLINIKSRLFNFCVLQLPKRKKKIVVIKSPHVFNKSREHFETIIFKKLVLVILDNDYSKFFFERFIKGFFWSMFGVSVKKVRLVKKCFYISK